MVSFEYFMQLISLFVCFLKSYLPKSYANTLTAFWQIEALKMHRSFLLPFGIVLFHHLLLEVSIIIILLAMAHGRRVQRCATFARPPRSAVPSTKSFRRVTTIHDRTDFRPAKERLQSASAYHRRQDNRNRDWKDKQWHRQLIKQCQRCKQTGRGKFDPSVLRLTSLPGCLQVDENGHRHERYQHRGYMREQH